ncbi:hypothetical protein K501DRAFT_218000, partial [Backusella circina FSU 941]
MTSIYEQDVFKASQILEAELIGKGYTASSLASELQSATFSSSSTSLSSEPLQSIHSLSKTDSRRSSQDSSTDELAINERDPFGLLKGQLDELNSAVCETKSLHSKLCNTLLLDNSLSSDSTGSYAPPLELLITSMVGLMDRKSRDRERQTTFLKSIDASIRKASHWMTVDLIRELEQFTTSLNQTLHDERYTFDNPLPVLRCLSTETVTTTESMEELKELMFVNKHQVQELNVRLRVIAKTVHDVRMDTRKLSRIFQATCNEDDDQQQQQQQQQQTFLEKGQVEQRVKEIMCDLDELDTKFSKKL